MARRGKPKAMSGLAEETRWMDATDQATLVAKGEVTPSELWRPRSSGSSSRTRR